MRVALRGGAISIRVFLAIIFYGYKRFIVVCAIPFTTSQARQERIEFLQADGITRFLERLGATWIKIGQILSARPDLLPPHIITGLQKLQDEVEPVSVNLIRVCIENDLGKSIDELFSEFENEPVAAASIAQVHKAQLHTGESVAVKVQRPNIADMMDRDLNILELIATFANIFPSMRSLALKEQAGEFARAIKAQRDFRLEVKNNRRFAEDFKNTSFVCVPDIYDEFCGEKTITMSWANGQRFRDGIENPPKDRHLLADQIIEMYFAMGFEHKFVHADLHPGNLQINQDGAFVLLDMGLVYEVPTHYVRKFVRVLTAATLFDGRMMAEAYFEGLDIPEDKLEAAYADADDMMSRYKGLSYSEMEMSEATIEILALLRKHKIYVDAEWTGFMLAEVTFEGIAKMMDKDVDILDLFVKKLPHYIKLSGAMEENDPLALMATAANN